MEILMMFVLHAVKMSQYFLINGMPEVNIDGFVWQLAKIINIYLSMLG